MEINRKALIAYLQNIRDLEVAKYQVEKSIEKEHQTYNQQRSINLAQQKSCLKEMQYYKEAKMNLVSEDIEKPKKVGMHILVLLCFALCVFIPLILIFIFIANVPYAEMFFIAFGSCSIIIFCYVIFGIPGIVLYYYTTYKRNKIARLKYIEKVKNAKAYNESERKRVENFPIYYSEQETLKNRIASELKDITNKHNEMLEYWQNEKIKLENMLQSNYSLNILPNVYRNLASVYYIYDYMSSGQATFEETLIHEHMKNGIQRLSQQLNYIINQNEQIIFQNRQNELLLQNINEGISNLIYAVSDLDNTVSELGNEMISQNTKLLKGCAKIETNTEQSALYAKMAANYAEADAYFSLANYLK